MRDAGEGEGKVHAQTQATYESQIEAMIKTKFEDMATTKIEAKVATESHFLGMEKVSLGGA